MKIIHLKQSHKPNNAFEFSNQVIMDIIESTKAKIDRLINTRGKTRKDIALSLAVFSAFNEGVSLFSSFAILLNFKRFNKLKGVGTIIEWSIRDESLHSEAGCWLFNTFVSEYPEIWNDELKKELYDAARLTIQLEDDYIDRAFSFGEIEGIDAYSLKQYMRLRCNTKLNDIGLKKNWKNIDMEAAKSITSWFDLMAAGEQFTDFFSTKPTNYSKSVISFDKIWE
jgi:ribonucleoside-diphosphate reductase beta chain